MQTYSFEDFKSYIYELNAKYGSYFIEIMLTDFYCFEKEIEADKIYISQSINDGKIDAIVVPKDINTIDKKTIYFIQVSTSSKDKKYINDFIKQNPYQIKQYTNILKDYPEGSINNHKVLMTFDSPKYYSSFDDLEILSGDNLFECIFENSIRYKLIYDKNKLNDKYIENLETRMILWTDLHRLKIYDSDTINSYVYFLTLNNNAIKNNQFNLIYELKSIWQSYYYDVLSSLRTLDYNVQNEVINSDNSTIDILITIFKYTRKLDISLINLVKKLIAVKNDNPLLKNIELQPTKYYLSIYSGENKCIAYFQYEYLKDVKKSRFSFKCNFDRLDNSSKNTNSLISTYLKNGRIVSTESEKANNPGLKHSGMSTTLTYPTDSDNDWNVIKELLCLSINDVQAPNDNL